MRLFTDDTALISAEAEKYLLVKDLTVKENRL